MPPRRKKPPQHPALENKVCPHCGDIFNSRGFVQHERSCLERPEEPILVIDDTAGARDPGPGEDGTSRALLCHGWFRSNPEITDDEIQIAAIADNLHTADDVERLDRSTDDNGRR